MVAEATAMQASQSYTNGANLLKHPLPEAQATGAFLILSAMERLHKLSGKDMGWGKVEAIHALIEMARKTFQPDEWLKTMQRAGGVQLWTGFGLLGSAFDLVDAMLRMHKENEAADFTASLQPCLQWLRDNAKLFSTDVVAVRAQAQMGVEPAKVVLQALGEPIEGPLVWDPSTASSVATQMLQQAVWLETLSQAVDKTRAPRQPS